MPRPEAAICRSLRGNHFADASILVSLATWLIRPALQYQEKAATRGDVRDEAANLSKRNAQEA